MRILLLTNSHLPTIGGKEIVVHHLALAYRRCGHDIAVAGPGGLWRFRRFDPGYKVYRWPQIPGLSHGNSSLAMLRLTNSAFRSDVIHAHAAYPAGYLACKSSLSKTTPVVVTPHGNDIHSVPEINFGMRLNPKIEPKIRWTLGRADYTTAISISVEQSLREAGARSDRIVPIQNGVDLERFTTKVDYDIRHHLGFPDEAKLIVTTGNYHPRKGHEVLVDAFANVVVRVPEARLVIVGRTSPSVAEKVAQLGLSQTVNLMGAVPFPLPGDKTPDIIAVLLQQASSYVSSSMAQGTEGLSLALLEGMASGACIVATKISGNEDVIEHGENGVLVEPGSSSALADGLVSILTDEGLRLSLVQRARSTAGRFAWEAKASEYIELFQRAINERSL